MNFTKLHGLGNDFILIEQRPPARPLTPAEASALCDRRAGIGADGTLELRPAPSGLSLVIRNADGSRPEMCGNGLRCVGRYLSNRGRLPAAGITILTDAGPRLVHRSGRDLSVEMGPVHLSDRPTLALTDRALSGELYDVGNPHLVLWGAWSPADVTQLGPKLERHPRFPDGVNVAFAAPPTRGAVEVTIWERGSGLTGACGSGACAVATAAWARGATGPLTVRQPGGALTISQRATGVVMTGPATEVYTGRWRRPRGDEAASHNA